MRKFVQLPKWRFSPDKTPENLLSSEPYVGYTSKLTVLDVGRKFQQSRSRNEDPNAYLTGQQNFRPVAGIATPKLFDVNYQ